MTDAGICEQKCHAYGIGCPCAGPPLTMTSDQWLGALADSWWLGHRDVCADCNCPDDRNPYHIAPAGGDAA